MREKRPTLVWTPEMAARFWDFESNFPERYFTHRHGAEMVRQLRRYVLGGGIVLDYGCGPGYLLEEFLDAGVDAAGLDFSPETIRKVNERLGGRPNFRGAYVLDDFVPGQERFGVITVVEVIEHLYDEPLEQLLENLRGFLAPGGIVMFTTPNEEKLAESTLLCPVSGEVFHRWQHVRSWSSATLTGYLEDHRYRVLSCFATNFRGGLTKAKKKGAVAKRWAVLKSEIARRARGRVKTPHLVAIARPEPGESDG